ncbi:hypothetical protein, partial [Escherichia coli]|uniref:hypothetical protein n=2 Tax=Escherichia coli TaxID=562 RepID=UPI001BDBACDF
LSYQFSSDGYIRRSVYAYQHSDRECLYKAEVTMTGKGTRFQEWMPVFFTVNILALVIPGYLQKSSITMTERG